MIKKLNVYLYQNLIGELTQNSAGQLRFRYLAQWLNNPDAIAISKSLPLQTKEYSQKECRSFFAGILPEESNRDIIARILGITARNDYSMLENIGGECAGAISFLKPGIKPSIDNYQYRQLDEQNLYDLLVKLPTNPLLVGEQDIRLSLAGAQNKIAVYIDKQNNISLPLDTAPSTHILKPAIEWLPNIVSNEALCLTLAKLIGIPSANVTIKQTNNIEYLLIERYDRIKTDNYPNRLHQEDFCQALAIAPENKYQAEGGPSLKDCFALIRKYSTSPAYDLQNLLNIVIFNLIVGNNDAHGKNFSFLYNGKTTSLTPAYDILSTIYYPKLTTKMAMKFGQEYQSNNITPSSIAKFAQETDINSTLIKKRIAEIANNITKTLPELKDSFNKVIDLIDLIEQRAKFIKQIVASK